MKKTTIASLIATITAFAQALSRIPITSSAVTRATIAAAGRLKMIGTPRTCGAAATIAGSPSAVRRSVASQGGRWMPIPLRRLVK